MAISLLRTALFSCLALTAFCTTAANDVDDVFRRERAQFVREYASISNGEASDQSAGESLRNYPLYPYLQAARLRYAVLDAPLSDANDAGVIAFLNTHGSDPVTREVSHEWLTIIADHARWYDFLTHS